MDIGYVWDEDKYQRVQQQHQVEFWEVVSAFDDEQSLEQPDPQGNWDRYLMVAQTNRQRLLQIIYTETFTEEGSMPYRIITAFDAGKEWHDEYQAQSK